MAQVRVSLSLFVCVRVFVLSIRMICSQNATHKKERRNQLFNVRFRLIIIYTEKECSCFVNERKGEIESIGNSPLAN